MAIVFTHGATKYLVWTSSSFTNEFQALYFTSTDCTGTPHAPSWPREFWMASGSGAFIVGDTLYVTTQPGAQTTVRSIREGDGSCSAVQFTTTIAPVTSMGTIGTFTPPFKVRFN